MDGVIQILEAVSKGESKAAEELIPLVYDELRRLAAYQLAREKPGQTLQATALVHEAYLRLVTTGKDSWENRRHFFGAAAEAMRRIVIENARRKKRLQHGGDLKRVDLDIVQIEAGVPSEELLALDEALEEFTREEPEAAELVRLRFFIGLTQEQAAQIIGVSRRTANSLWAFARAWLYRALHPDDAP